MKFHMGDYLLLGKGELATGGRTRPSMLADAFEAVVGAIYIDSSYEEARKFILHQLKDYLDLVDSGHYEKDYKRFSKSTYSKTVRSISSIAFAGQKDRTMIRLFTWKSWSMARYSAKDRENQKNMPNNTRRTKRSCG